MQGSILSNYFLQGATIPDIVQILDCEGIATCRQTVWQLKQHVHCYSSKYITFTKIWKAYWLTNEALTMIELLMQRDDETIAKQLVLLLGEMGLLYPEAAP